MAHVDARTVMSQLKKGEIHNFYYIYGPDISGVEALTKAIIKKATGDNTEFALNKLDGGELNVSEFRDMTEMMPMLSDYNCILVNDYNCEAEKEEKNKQLIDALKEIPQHTVVIFNITGFDVKNGKKTVQGKNKKLADLAAKNGISCELVLKNINDLAKDIAARVSSRGSMITLPAARELAEMCLSDTLLISNEIDKLCAYAREGEITSETIKLLVPQRSDITVYKLSDAVAAFNKKAAFAAIDELIEQRVGRGAILGTISSSFIDMYRAACARQSGKNIDNVMRDFSYKWEFIVEKAYKYSSRMSVKRLRECLDILCDTAVQLNSTACDEKTALEQAVAKMLMTKN